MEVFIDHVELAKFTYEKVRMFAQYGLYQIRLRGQKVRLIGFIKIIKKYQISRSNYFEGNSERVQVAKMKSLSNDCFNAAFLTYYLLNRAEMN